MPFNKKHLTIKEPTLFKNFYFKRTIRQYLHFLKISIIRIFRFNLELVKNLKWK